MASLAKWLRVRLRSKQLRFRASLQSVIANSFLIKKLIFWSAKQIEIAFLGISAVAS